MIKQATALRVTRMSHGLLHRRSKNEARRMAARNQDRLSCGNQVRVQKHADLAA